MVCLTKGPRTLWLFGEVHDDRGLCANCGGEKCTTIDGFIRRAGPVDVFVEDQMVAQHGGLVPRSPLVRYVRKTHSGPARVHRIDFRRAGEHRDPSSAVTPDRSWLVWRRCVQPVIRKELLHLLEILTHVAFDAVPAAVERTLYAGCARDAGLTLPLGAYRKVAKQLQSLAPDMRARVFAYFAACVLLDTDMAVGQLTFLMDIYAVCRVQREFIRDTGMVWVGVEHITALVGGLEACGYTRTADHTCSHKCVRV